jgi:hypothetical protein
LILVPRPGEGKEADRQRNLVVFDASKVKPEEFRDRDLAIAARIDELAEPADKEIHAVSLEALVGERMGHAKGCGGVPDRGSDLGEPDVVAMSNGLQHVELDEIDEGQ